MSSTSYIGELGHVHTGSPRLGSVRFVGVGATHLQAYHFSTSVDEGPSEPERVVT